MKKLTAIVLFAVAFALVAPTVSEAGPIRKLFRGVGKTAKKVLPPYHGVRHGGKSHGACNGSCVAR